MVSSLAMVAMVACGPAPRPGEGDDDDGGGGADGPPGSCVTQTEICRDGLDNDCDSRADCADPDCSGIDGCPVCGAVENPEGQPLALPDGTSVATACTTNAQCTNASAPNCVRSECHGSYTSTLNFVGFPQGATLDDPNKLLSVCVKMEHSWLRDLQMELIAPDGRIFILHEFVSRNGGEIFLGEANDNDSAASPVPGVGYNYCWKPTASTIMLNASTTPVPDGVAVPAGDYKSVSPWTSLTGVQLNGTWTIRVTDLWSADNGFIFKWSIAFDSSLVLDCSGPIIL